MTIVTDAEVIIVKQNFSPLRGMVAIVDDGRYIRHAQWLHDRAPRREITQRLRRADADQTSARRSREADVFIGRRGRDGWDRDVQSGGIEEEYLRCLLSDLLGTCGSEMGGFLGLCIPLSILDL